MAEPITLTVIDPGPEQSGLVSLTRGDVGCELTLHEAAVLPNDEVLTHLRDGADGYWHYLVIEGFTSYGRVVGKSSFDTCVWIGRFGQAWIESQGIVWTSALPPIVIPKPRWSRRLAKLAKMPADKALKDAKVREACLKIFENETGAKRKVLVGTKKSPGPLKRVTSHGWSALGLGIAAENFIRANEVDESLLMR